MSPLEKSEWAAGRRLCSNKVMKQIDKAPLYKPIHEQNAELCRELFLNIQENRHRCIQEIGSSTTRANHNTVITARRNKWSIFSHTILFLQQNTRLPVVFFCDLQLICRDLIFSLERIYHRLPWVQLQHTCLAVLQCF